jgi:hypothetical protein
MVPGSYLALVERLPLPPEQQQQQQQQRTGRREWGALRDGFDDLSCAPLFDSTAAAAREAAAAAAAAEETEL